MVDGVDVNPIILKLLACIDMMAPVLGEMAFLKSCAYVLLVVPTSFRVDPLCSKTSGIRNPPPISTDSERDMIISLPFDIAARPKVTAVALLFTMIADSAPVRSHNKF